MSQRTSYEPGVPCFVATIQPDPRAAADFYGAVLGWTFTGDEILVARLRDEPVAAVTPLPPNVEPQPSPTWITDVAVASADDAAAKTREAGGTVLAEPFDGPSGRMTVIQDPTGGVVAACERATGAAIVNEFGAWAMSALMTPDPEAAAAFYGAVFGWTTEAMGEATLFRLPGYVGGEPEQPVSREVVAAMMPGEQAGWAVDFWVRDVDATAGAAKAHGGGVIAEPFDTPLGREAVLSDPAGVPFMVTRVAAVPD